MELGHGLRKTPQGAGFFPAHRVIRLEGRSQKMTTVDAGKRLRSFSEVVTAAAEDGAEGDRDKATSRFDSISWYGQK